MNEKITLPELVEQVSEATNTTQRMSELFLRELLATVTEALVAGENVSIKDLGMFKLQKGDGEAHLLFVPAKKLAEALNQPFEAFVPVELDDDVTEQALAQAAEAAGPAEPAGTVAPKEPAEAEMPAEPAGADEPEPVTAMLVHPQAVPTDALLDQVRREVAQQAAHTALWKGLAIGLVAGVLVTTLMLRVLLPTSTTATPAANNAPAADTAAVADVPDRQAVKAQPVVTDTISATMYLTKMAIKHYGRQEFWVYIYEENKALISNPNHIKLGTVMVIPPADKYGIDPDDPTSVALAEQRSMAIFSRYK